MTYVFVILKDGEAREYSDCDVTVHYCKRNKLKRPTCFEATATPEFLREEAKLMEPNWEKIELVGLQLNQDNFRNFFKGIEPTDAFTVDETMMSDCAEGFAAAQGYVVRTVNNPRRFFAEPGEIVKVPVEMKAYMGGEIRQVALDKR